VEVHLQHRQARQQEVAELPPLHSGPGAIQCRAKERLVLREQRLQLGKLVSAAGDTGIIARDFLEAQHVAFAHRLRHARDAREVDAAIATAPALDVPGQDRRHSAYLMPACMNDCMNCRWNSRNATRSGATAMIVPALDHRPIHARLGRAEDRQAHRPVAASRPNW